MIDEATHRAAVEATFREGHIAGWCRGVGGYNKGEMFGDWEESDALAALDEFAVVDVPNPAELARASEFQEAAALDAIERDAPPAEPDIVGNAGPAEPVTIMSEEERLRQHKERLEAHERALADTPEVVAITRSVARDIETLIFACVTMRRFANTPAVSMGGEYDQRLDRLEHALPLVPPNTPASE